VEEALAALWSELLGIDRIGRHDDFFSLGGHSLLAVRLATKLPQIFRAEMPLKNLFELPTIAQLSRRIEAILWAVGNRQSSFNATAESQEEGVL
jgi:acyl carrier protein